MSIVAVPNTFSANTTISSSEVNANFSTIYNEFNGSISAANLATDAVTTGKIANSAVTTDKINDSAVTTVKLANNAVTSEKLAVAQQNSTPGAVGDIGTGNSTLATLSVPAGTWFIYAKGNTTVSVAQQTQATVEIYNSTDAAVIDTTVAGSDYTSGTDSSSTPFSVAKIVTLTGTKTIITRARVNDGSGTFAINNVTMFAIPVGV